MNFPHEVDLDGQYDSIHNGSDENKGYIRYIGKATLQPNGMFKVLAQVNNALCIVEVRITFPALTKSIISEIS
jgi:hypothetical protein